MELYNCESKEELELKETELQALTIDELHELAEGIYVRFQGLVLKDENIVVSAIRQINLELLKRLKEYKEDTGEVEEQKCRLCGCTWDNACKNGCYWVEEDLCSECIEGEIS